MWILSLYINVKTVLKFVILASVKIQSLKYLVRKGKADHILKPDLWIYNNSVNLSVKSRYTNLKLWEISKNRFELLESKFQTIRRTEKFGPVSGALNFRHSHKNKNNKRNKYYYIYTLIVALVFSLSITSLTSCTAKVFSSAAANFSLWSSSLSVSRNLGSDTCVLYILVQSTPAYHRNQHIFKRKYGLFMYLRPTLINSV